MYVHVYVYVQEYQLKPIKTNWSNYSSVGVAFIEMPHVFYMVI